MNVTMAELSEERDRRRKRSELEGRHFPIAPPGRDYDSYMKHCGSGKKAYYWVGGDYKKCPYCGRNYWSMEIESSHRRFCECGAEFVFGTGKPWWKFWG